MKKMIAALAFVASSAYAYDTDSTYDYQTGNSYTIEHDQDETRVRGNNYGNGTTWTQTQRRDGTYSGIDSRGNYYQGNQSGYYMNSDGTICVGNGAARSCSR